MNRLGDAPTDWLFGLMALHNDLIAPAVIPAALRAQAREPGRSLAQTFSNNERKVRHSSLSGARGRVDPARTVTGTPF